MWLNSSNDNASPPPLPPHKAPLGWRLLNDNGNEAEDYKPPIPPHRNTSNGLTRMPDTPRRRHHHQRANSSSGGDHGLSGGSKRHESSSKHHHHRASKSSRSKSSSNGSSSASGKQPSSVDVVNDNSNTELAFVEVRPCFLNRVSWFTILYDSYSEI